MGDTLWIGWVFGQGMGSGVCEIMAGIKLKGLDRGINGADPYDEVGVGDAVPGSVNCLYCDGKIQTPDGFKVITDNGLPLASGENILAVFKYTEQDRTEHLLALTATKVFHRDTTQDTWDELLKGSGSVPAGLALTANMDNPVSWAIMDSTDGAFLDDGAITKAYRHLLMSDGGQSTVKRWAGKYEAKRWPLKGGDGYHDPASDSGEPAHAPYDIHYARQVLVFQNHVFLMNTREYDSSNILRETFSRLRWGMAGKLEHDLTDASAYDYTKIGAGYRDLVNTGDQNQWAMPLGNNLIVYQKRTIWTGVSMPSSDDAFSFDVSVEGIGLLSSRLLASDGTRHFFIGSDHVLRSYYGGQQFQAIEGRIGEELRNAIDYSQADRCFMCMGANYRRLWIFVIGTDEAFSVKAYGLDLRNGSWQVRDYSHEFGTTKGVTSSNLIGSQSYMMGPSYQDLLDEVLSIPETPDTTYFASTPLVETPSGTAWSGTGYRVMTGTGSKWATAPNKVNAGDFVIVTAGTNVVTGVYVVSSVTSDTVMELTSGIGNGGGAVSAVTYAIAPRLTYLEELYEVLASDMLVLGSSDGYIYQNDPALATDNGDEITAIHMTKVFDFDTPDQFKFWPGIVIKASGTAVTVSYRIDNFDTVGTGWVDFAAQTLTDMLRDYTFNIHQQSTAIQFKFSSTSKFQISKAFIMQPTLEGEV
jgi:hypothetical protein